MPQVELTVDIWPLIVDILGSAMESYEPEDHTTAPLKSLSLTCKAMVPLCRKHLFSSLTLDTESPRALRFKNLISDNPDIILYVRNLLYFISDPIDVKSQAILGMLKNRSLVLKSIDLCPVSKELEEWGALSPSLQILLEQLIHLPSITELELSRMTNVPSTILTGCANLKKITLHRVDFAISKHIQDKIPVFTPSPVYLCGMHETFNTIKFLMELRGPSHQGILDFSGLRDIALYLDKTCDAPSIWKVFRISTMVQFLRLSLGEPVPLAGLGASLSVASLSTLKRLTIFSDVMEEDQDPLCGLPAELRIIAKVNILEEIFLGLSLCVDDLSRPVTEDWAALDLVLTTPESFPELKLVSMEVTWPCHNAASGEFVRVNVRDEYFPRLVEIDAVKFELLVKPRCTCANPDHPWLCDNIGE